MQHKILPRTTMPLLDVSDDAIALALSHATAGELALMRRVSTTFASLHVPDALKLAVQRRGPLPLRYSFIPQISLLVLLTYY